jgi:WD40 repeat protein
VVFTPAGAALISGGEDGQVIRWDLADGSGEVLPVSAWRVSALALSADGTLAVGGGDGRIHLWSLTGEPSPRLLVRHSDQVTALAVEPSGPWLVSGGRDRTLRLWALPSGRLIRTLTAPQAAITALACHPQDGRIVSGDAEGHVQVWSAADGAAGLVIYKAAGPITALALADCGNWLAIGAEDGTLCLLHLGGRGQTVLGRHGWAVAALAFTPDSRMLVSSSADETISFWCLQEDAD